MKIAIDARSLRNDGGGGVSLRMFKVINHVLEVTDHSLVLFCRDDLTFQNMGIDPQYESRVLFVGIGEEGMGPSTEAYEVDINVIPKLIKEHKPDIFHACANWGTSSNEIRVPSVLTVHDIIPFFVREAGYKNDEFFAFYKELIVSSVRNATKIITVSRYSKNAVIEKFGISDDKIKVVYNGMDSDSCPEDYYGKGDALLTKHGLTRGKYFVYVGGFYERKNVMRLLSAFRSFLLQHRDFKLVVTGASDSSDYVKEQYEQFENSVADISDHVAYLGYVSREELNTAIANSVALVYPSISEGFGIPILEAMSLGVPALCANNTVLPEVGEDAAIYFDPFNEQQITERMVEIVSDETLRKEKITLGLERAKAFSWQETCRSVLAVYESLHP